MKSVIRAPGASAPVLPPDRESVERAAIRCASRFAPQFAVPRWSGEASPLPRTRPGRSTRFTLFAHQLGAVEFTCNRLAPSQTLAQFHQGWPLSDLFDLHDQIVR